MHPIRFMAAAGGGMIRAKKLHEILAGRLGSGVRAAMVFNHDGALLGAASLPSSAAAGAGAGAGGGEGEGGGIAEAGDAESDVLPTKEAAKEASVMAAVTSHIWSTYEGMGIEPGQPLETLLFKLEGASIVALPAGPHHLVALIGAGGAEVGLLLTKAQALGEFLREAFRQVQAL